MGFSDWSQLEPILFVFILVFYSLTIFGNTTIITLSLLERQLHTPMYFFLRHLSFLDLCYTTSTVPQLLINLHGLDRTISYEGCVVQLFSSLALHSHACPGASGGSHHESAGGCAAAPGAVLRTSQRPTVSIHQQSHRGHTARSTSSAPQATTRHCKRQS